MSIAPRRAPLHGDYIALAVQDSGSGVLSEEQMTRMFEPFFTTKPTSKGSGIGLAVVHGIAHELGARSYAIPKRRGLNRQGLDPGPVITLTAPALAEVRARGEPATLHRDAPFTE